MKTTNKEGAGNTPSVDYSTNELLHGSTPAGVTELLAAGVRLAGPQHLEGREPFVVLKDKDGGEQAVPLPHETLPPLADHVRAKSILGDAESFAAYVKRYQTGETVIFATLPTQGEPPKFTAIFDYHAGAKDGEATKQARRCAHIAEYPCPWSENWKAWMAQNGKGLSQKDFIDFVEANSPDIAAPNSADLLELALNFESKSDVEFQSKIDRVTGGRALVFKETVEAHAGTGKIKVPDRLELALPVFAGGANFSLLARLEYRVNNSKLSIAYHLQRPHEVVRDALQTLREEIAAATNIEPMIGRAENFGR